MYEYIENTSVDAWEGRNFHVGIIGRGEWLFDYSDIEAAVYTIIASVLLFYNPLFSRNSGFFWEKICHNFSHR